MRVWTDPLLETVVGESSPPFVIAEEMCAPVSISGGGLMGGVLSACTSCW
jgi:hypothetical protein